MGLFYWGRLVGNYGFLRVGSNVYKSARVSCSFLACSLWVSKISNILDISPALPPFLIQTVSLPTWKLSCFLSVHLIVVTSCLVLFWYLLCWPVVFQYQYLKGNRPVINNPNLTWSLLVKPGSLQVFESSCNLSVKMCKTLFESQRTHYAKLNQSKSSQAPKEMAETAELHLGHI